MVAGKSNINELISFNPRFLRSVHLERDFYAKDTIDGYLVTRGSLAALSLLAHLRLESGYRGWLALVVAGSYHGLNPSPQLT